MAKLYFIAGQYGIIFLFPLIFGVRSCPVECSCSRKTVDCVGKNLVDIPSDIPDNTRYLLLERNKLQEINDVNLRHLTKLRTLNLKNNQIESIQPGVLDNLSSLRILELTSNRIKNLPDKIFSNLEKLTDLDLSNNEIQNIDGVFTNLRNLFQLDLTSNNLNWLATPSFRDLRKLRYLKLGGNNISIVDDSVFRRIPKLSYLNIRENPLNNVDGMFSSNNALTYIELTQCHLQHFPRLLPQDIQYLQLGQNNISSIEKQEISHYSSLQILVIDRNNIKFVEDNAFADLENLQELWLNLNNLKTIPRGLPRGLKTFHMDSNKVNRIVKECFHESSVMETLSLQGNLIIQLERESFKTLKQLKNLHLAGNYFTAFPDHVFADLTNLKILKLDQNDITDIGSHVFAGLSNLTDLGLSYIIAPPGAIQGNIFQHLKSLKILSLQESAYITETLLSSENMLNSLSTVEDLNLMDNQIKTLQISFMKKLPRLTIIKISGNQFHCDRRIRWLKQWLHAEVYKFLNVEEIECYTPLSLHGHRIVSLPLQDFVAVTGEMIPTTTITTTTVDVLKNTKIKPTVLETKNIITGPKKISTMIVNKETQPTSTYSERTTTQANDVTSIYIPNNLSTVAITSTFKGVVLVSQSQIRDENSDSDDMDNTMVIAIATSLTITTVVIIIVVVAVLLCHRKNYSYRRSLQYQDDNDTVFAGSFDERQTGLSYNRKTREDRGSVTSKADEDITNECDTTMKVYTWDGNQ